jgi:hypothetical protein
MAEDAEVPSGATHQPQLPRPGACSDQMDKPDPASQRCAFNEAEDDRRELVAAFRQAGWATNLIEEVSDAIVCTAARVAFC